MSETEFNSYLIKAVLHVLKQFSGDKLGRNEKKHDESVKLILNNILSTHDYAVFLSSACVYNKTLIPLTLIVYESHTI